MMDNNNYKFGSSASINQIDELLDYFTQAGLTNLEINFSKFNSPLNSFSNELHDKIKRAREETGLKISFHLPFTENISDNIPMMRKRSISNLKSFVRTCVDVNAELMTIHPGIFYWFPIEKRMRERALKRFVNAMNDILITCAEYNVKIALENLVPIPQGSEFFFLGDNLGDFQFIFENIKSDYLGFCLDTGHANIAEGVTSYIESFGERLINVHYHDNKGSNDNHLIIGDGNIDWHKTAEAFNNIRYKGPFISECRGIKPDAAAEKLKFYLSTSSPTKSHL